MTPNRPDATCFTAHLAESPFGSGTHRASSSPPSPELLAAPIRFMAIASVSCASLLSDPKDMAEVTNRFTIASTGSTSARGTGSAAANPNRPRSVQRLFASSFMSAA